MSGEDIPEPDRAEGAIHPRQTTHLFGQQAAEETFLQAFLSGRLHHGWLICGPRGIGKATLAWRIARFMLSQDDASDGGLFDSETASRPTTLDADRNHPAVRRSYALGEPRLYLCRIPWDDKKKRLKTAITIDEVRKLKRFFNLSAADGGWRVAIIDAADELNPQAANALLKLLEEPPEKTSLLLVCHQPAKLLPTIRSRCQPLRCAKLSRDNQALALRQAGYEAGTNAEALALLSDGSVGAALRLLNGGGIALYQALVTLAAAAPGLERGAAIALADKCSGRDAAPRFDMTLHLITVLLSRLARYGALQPSVWSEAAPGEALMLAKLAPNAAAARKWVDLSQTLTGRVMHARAVHLDPSGVILDMLLKLNETARD